MRYRRAAERLRTLADACQQMINLGPDEPFLRAAYVFGDVLSGADPIDTIEVALAIDLPPAQVPWSSHPPETDWLVDSLRLDKGGFAYWWRSRHEPVWNHLIHEPVRFWSPDGPDEAVLDALRDRRFAELPRMLASPAQQRRRAEVELDRALDHLRVVRQSYWERDWRTEHRGGGRYPEDHLWRAADGYLDLLDRGRRAVGKPGSDDPAVRERLERAIEIADFVDYRAAYGYFRGVDAALDEVAGLVQTGAPDAAAELAAYALELLEGVAGRVDDSDGGLLDAIAQAEEIHLDGCAEGRPDPVALAERLFHRAVRSDLQVFLAALPDYEPVLGPRGMARYRELVEQAWNALPPKKPHEFGGNRSNVTHMMERLAETTGGTDALIEVLSRDVVAGYEVLPIAERLCAAGRDDEALEWLTRGLSEFPPDRRLRSMAAACHVRAGRPADAAELLWANFAEDPVLANYIALHDGAGEEFPPWRERAIELLRALPPAEGRFVGYLARPPGHATLVEVLLWEGDADAAWQAAMHGGCRDDLWMRLARQRAADHPADAIPVLLEAADQEIARKDRDHYRSAAGLLTEAVGLFARCGRPEDLEAHLTALRTEHRAKRALCDELDRAGLP